MRIIYLPSLPSAAIFLTYFSFLFLSFTLNKTKVNIREKDAARGWEWGRLGILFFALFITISPFGDATLGGGRR